MVISLLLGATSANVLNSSLPEQEPIYENEFNLGDDQFYEAHDGLMPMRQNYGSKIIASSQDRQYGYAGARYSSAYNDAQPSMLKRKFDDVCDHLTNTWYNWGLSQEDEDFEDEINDPMTEEDEDQMIQIEEIVDGDEADTEEGEIDPDFEDSEVYDEFDSHRRLKKVRVRY